MKRLLLAVLLLMLSFSSGCGNLSFLSGQQQMGTEVGNPWGTEIGNPNNPSPDITVPANSPLNVFAQNLCAMLERCNPNLAAQQCSSQLASATQLDKALGLPQVTYSNFAYLEQAQLEGRVQVNSTQLQSCNQALVNYDCQSPTLAQAYGPTNAAGAGGSTGGVTLSTTSVWQVIPPSACGSVLY